MTRVACVPLAPRIADLAANRALTVAAIRGAVAGGAEVVVLPELATSGYVLSGEEARAVAVSATDSLFDDWASAAEDAVVVGGFCELGADGLLYNSAAIVGGGVRARYRKTHLWDTETVLFTPGIEPPPVVETKLGRIGVPLCYDLEFPELVRGLALRGADLVAAPVNWPLLDRPEGERPPEVVQAMAAARTNRLFMAVCDRFGTERGQRWTEGTCVVTVAGWVAAVPGDDGVAWADLDLERARDKTLSPHNDALGDRRPSLYPVP